MAVKYLILLSLLPVSLAYGHPNHMSFEELRHVSNQLQSGATASDKLSHDVMQVKHGQDVNVPCTEQHKMQPCKKKH